MIRGGEEKTRSQKRGRVLLTEKEWEQFVANRFLRDEYENEYYFLCKYSMNKIKNNNTCDIFFQKFR